MRTYRKNKFTLLEVMLALGVLLVIAALTAEVIYTLPKSAAEQQQQARRLKELTALDRVADNAVRNAVPMSWQNENRESKPIFRGDKNLLMFAFRHRINDSDEVGLRFLALGLREKQLIAQYRDEPQLPWLAHDPLPESVNEETILKGVASFQLLYADWKDGKLTWLEDWDEENRPELPQAIGWIIRFEDGQEVKYLRRTAGNSYYTTWGRRSDVTKKQ